jgi:hypothetical protein
MNDADDGGLDPLAVAIARRNIEAAVTRRRVDESQWEFIRRWCRLLTMAAEKLGVRHEDFSPYDFVGISWAIIVAASKARIAKSPQRISDELYAGIHKFHSALSRAALKVSAERDAASNHAGPAQN